MNRNSGGSYGDREPVFALATGLSGPLALIRTSGGKSDGEPDRADGSEGESAIVLLSRIFSRPRKLLDAPGNTVIHGWILDREGGKIDEALVSVYRSPKSYTGEDGADISCHGGIAAVRAVTESLRAAGFREALPGEFSFRAFMNGKLDLTRCESIMELVNARTETGRDRAVERLSGVLYREIGDIKGLLVAVLAETELYLDYDEYEAAPPGEGRSPEQEGGTDLPEWRGRNLAEEGLARLRVLADSWQVERLYQEGVLAVIAGRPNAGKSSLFNLLLKEDRAIVTDTPGTTRDWIEATLSVEGIPLRLADTAGLREDENGGSLGGGTARTGGARLDPVEEIGIRRSRELIDQADLVIYVIDGTTGYSAEDAAFLRNLRDKAMPVILLWNKADLAMPPAELAAVPPLIPVSAKTGQGTAELIRAIGTALQASTETAGMTALSQRIGLGSVRQKELVDAAIAALGEALSLADSEEPLDLIAPLLREGLNALGEITGEVSTADILETMFGKFCVGK
ncbi:MAG: tRNA uridine-5-carboxymethylaminomethyl(34) synthesis GTPase MnmE [Treponema sp.]|jgi:tRNA modification GTPase|nr:tRNA uridine-5-carboxymethylaminomethyl(34) synthesis GTPase MnmE [Treponema sp.]